MSHDVPAKIFRATLAQRDLAREAIEICHGRGTPNDGALDKFLADPDCYLILAAVSGQVVGSLYGYRLCTPHRVAPQFLLYEIDVLESHRRKGIGRALMDAFSAEAQAASAEEEWVVTNSSNEAAMALYQRSGYKRVNPDDVMLEKTLSPTS